MKRTCTELTLIRCPHISENLRFVRPNDLCWCCFTPPPPPPTLLLNISRTSLLSCHSYHIRKVIWSVTRSTLDALSSYSLHLRAVWVCVIGVTELLPVSFSHLYSHNGCEFIIPVKKKIQGKVESCHLTIPSQFFKWYVINSQVIVYRKGYKALFNNTVSPLEHKSFQVYSGNFRNNWVWDIGLLKPNYGLFPCMIKLHCHSVYESSSIFFFL